MAIQRSSPASVSVGTSGGTSGLFGLASSTTACSQSAVVTSSTTANLTGISANWDILMPAHTPSSSTVVNVYVWGTNDNSGYPGGSATAEVITGSAGTITLSVNGNSALKYLKQTLGHTASITIRDEADIVAVLGFIPARWGLVFQNQLGTTLPTSGHVMEYVETYYN